MATIIDASVLIEMERGNLSVFDFLPLDSLLPAIGLAELLMGANLALSARQLREARAFLADVRAALVVVPFGEDEAAQYALLTTTLKAAGQKIGDHDAQIAATALAGEHELMTYNVREFRQVPGPRLVPAPDL